MNDQENENQAHDWEALYEALLEEIGRHGTEGIEASADCFVVDENWGSLQQKIEVFNLKLLRPEIVRSLQLLLKSYPGWEIRIGVGMPNDASGWPLMGLTIRAHEIIDGLQRQYFPKEFQDIRYEGSRPGTEND